MNTMKITKLMPRALEHRQRSGKWRSTPSDIFQKTFLAYRNRKSKHGVQTFFADFSICTQTQEGGWALFEPKICKISGNICAAFGQTCIKLSGKSARVHPFQLKAVTYVGSWLYKDNQLKNHLGGTISHEPINGPHSLFQNKKKKKKHCKQHVKVGPC